MAKWTYFHDLDPFIIQLTENFGIRWYSMAYITGFIAGYLLIKWLIKKNYTPLSKASAIDLITWGAFGVIIGGRTGYALFYAPHILIEFDSVFPYWEFLKIHHGGLASHGGIIGLIIAICLFARRRGYSPYHCFDLIVLGGGLGICLGRIANFINGELYGRIIKGSTLWAVQFPKEMIAWVSEKKIEHLKDLSSAVSKLKTELNPNTWLEWVYQFESTGEYRAQIRSVIYSLIKACENKNAEVISALKEIIPYRHPSQIYQSLLEGLLPFLLVLFLWRNTKLKPGVIAGIWGSCYACMRILGEKFRMPDTKFGFEALGLTRGQWLSIFMLLGLFIYFILVFKIQKTEDK